MGTDQDKDTNEQPREAGLLTLQEYLDQQEALEKQAALQLPHKIDKCSYGIPEARQYQLVYGCLQCFESAECLKNSRGFGYCYACSVECHGDHWGVFEIGPRRDFDCECASTNYCRLLSQEMSLATIEFQSVRSAHNFEGLFCKCRQLIIEEDQEDDVQDVVLVPRSEMFQCLVCEDWFHENCLAISAPVDSTFDFICPGCAGLVGGSSLGSCSHISLDFPFEDKIPLYMEPGWQSMVCKCSQCLGYFSKHSLTNFILEPLPDLWAPEPDLTASRSLYELGLEAALTRLPPDKFDRALQAIGKLKGVLSQKLKDLREQGAKIVTVEDIESCLEEVKRH